MNFGGVILMNGRATFIFKNQHCCDPKLGGIMIPCDCKNLTGLIEIIEEE